MKSISPPDLTAYALNELPPDAAAELTRLLAESPAEAASAEETRAFCELLSTTLATPEAKDGGGLSAEQKQVITENLPPANIVHKFRWPLWAGAGAAAAVAAWLVLPHFPGKHSEVAVDNLSRATETRKPLAEEAKNTEAGWLWSDSKKSDSAPKAAPTARPSILAETYNLSTAAKPETADAPVDRGLIADGSVNGPQVASAPPMPAPPATPLVTDPAVASRSRYSGGPETELKRKEMAVNGAMDLRAPVDKLAANYSDAKDDASGKKMPTTASAAVPEARHKLLADAAKPSEPASAPQPVAARGGAEAAQTLSKLSGQAVPQPAVGNVELHDGEGVGADRLYRSVDETRFGDARPALKPASTTAESYDAPPENPFKQVAAEPLSTFSIDVDTASYANVRRFLNMGQRPPAEAVRVEELVNYFRYAYPAPEAGKPCSLTADLVVCPWNENHRLARVAVKARTDENRPKANLVFLLDVSGSMNEPNKLPLVKQSLKLLVDKLTENDRVSIVVYAGASGVVLPPTHGENKKAILGAIDNLQPGGSTNGASGITLAYEMARKEFLKEGVNRVILATDGDFNVGISDRNGLQSLIEKEAKSGVFLSVLGYGMGNLKDSTMETLADKGNGNYAYIDSLGEARKVLSEEMSSTLVTVAKDVKIQIEFNPGKVRAYKLLGYENRMLAKEDFNDDKKDAGEMGAGHTVTALYEITPADAPADVPPVDPLKYQPIAKAEEKAAAKPDSPEIMTVKLRYKAPDADVSQLMELPVMDKNAAVASAPGDFQFATAVASYGLLLRGSKQVGNLNWDMIRTMAKAGKGEDPDGYRGEFLQLLDKAASAVPLP